MVKGKRNPKEVRQETRKQETEKETKRESRNKDNINIPKQKTLEHIFL